MAKKYLQALIVFGVMLFLVGFAFAQEDAAAEAQLHGKSWFELFKTTGLVGILLLLTSLIGTGLLIQYILTINEGRLGNPALLDEVENQLTEGNLQEAYNMAEADPSYAGKVLATALGRSSHGPDAAMKGMEEASVVEAFRLNAKISFLSLVGNIGPLLGLLGTVTGMITSFQKIEKMKAPTPADLAVGVYESLVNTTIGLFIAIIFLSAYFFMKNKLSDLTLRINNQISDLIHRTIATEGAEGTKH